MDIPVDVDRRIIIDAGTGLRSLEQELDLSIPHEFTLLLTHYHWDHIQGLPLFGPLHDRRHRFTIYGVPREDMGVGEILGGVMRPPWFPVSLGEAAAGVVFKELSGPITVGPVTISHTRLRHPQGVVGYRLDAGDRSVMIATDHEAGESSADRRLAELAQGANVLIHDGQYTEQEQQGERAGWGHSSWDQAVRAAERAGAQRLVLTGHDPNRSDDPIDELVRAARRRFPFVNGAHEGMKIRL